MASIKFIVKAKTENATIYIRLRDGRNTDATTSTGYTINSEYWNFDNNEPKQTAKNQDKLNLKLQLERLKLFMLEQLNTIKGTGTTINKDWLENQIALFKNPELNNKSEYIIDLVKAYQLEMKTKINPKTKKPISDNTIRNFNTTLMRLGKFEQYKNKRYLLKEIGLSFKAEYVGYLSTNLSLSQNSINKDIKQIKTVCIDAVDKGYTINEQVRSNKFNVPTEATTFVTITESEIEDIKGFKGADYLENVRDWFIIGCWTACRVGDLMKLNNDNLITNIKGQTLIRYTQSKTNKQVDLPIHDDVKEILERLNGFPRPITDQRFNEWIKIVCRKVGLTYKVNGTRQNPETHLKEVGTFEKWELVRSHTMRRSFATNHYNKLNNKLIMHITGHKTESMLLNYIGEIDNNYIDDFENLWSNKQEHSKLIDLKTAK